MVEKIKWETFDYEGYSLHSYGLSGTLNGNTFCESVLDMFWGVPLMYKKWLIKRKLNILYG